MAQIFSRICSKDPLSHSSITMLVLSEAPSASVGSVMLNRLRGSSVSTAYTATYSGKSCVGLLAF